MASWVTRTPAIRDKLGASTAEMGLVLFGLSIGSMAGILSSGYLVQRFSTKPVIAAGTSLVIAGILLVALGAFFLRRSPSLLDYVHLAQGWAPRKLLLMLKAQM